MTAAPSSAEQPTLRDAVAALRSTTAGPFPENVAATLGIAARALNALAVSYWRLSGDGRSLRRLYRAGNRGSELEGERRYPADDDMRDRMTEPATRLDERGRTRSFPALAAMLDSAACCSAIVTIPVHLYGKPHGLLCAELSGRSALADLEQMLFVELVASRIEAAYLSEPASNRTTRTMDAGTPLGQSHLSLTDDVLRDIFYFAPTAMVLADIETARPIAANRHAFRLLGVPPDNGRDLRTSDFWDDTNERDEFIRQVLESGFVRGHRARLRRFNGEAFWARISSTRLEFEGKPAVMSSITDVSDAVAMEEVLHRTQQTLNTLLEAAPFPLVVTRLDTGVVRYCNRKAAELFEVAVTSLVGHTAPEFYVDPTDRTWFVDKLQETGSVEGFVALLKTGTGEPFWAILNARTLDLNGEPVFMVAFVDVTRQKKKEAELEHLAFMDGLTDAYNRRYFMEAGRLELARAERNGQQSSLALIDIDHFKRLNDTRGHDAGDQVLREFVTLVQSHLRKADVFARYGGEEFAILFPETDLETARGVLERIRAAVADHVFFADSRVTFSGGVVRAKAGDKLHAQMLAADRVLYEAKGAGRNCIRVDTQG